MRKYLLALVLFIATIPVLAKPPSGQHTRTRAKLGPAMELQHDDKAYAAVEQQFDDLARTVTRIFEEQRGSWDASKMVLYLYPPLLVESSIPRRPGHGRYFFDGSLPDVQTDLTKFSGVLGPIITVDSASPVRQYDGLPPTEESGCYIKVHCKNGNAEFLVHMLNHYGKWWFGGFELWAATLTKQPSLSEADKSAQAFAYQALEEQKGGWNLPKLESKFATNLIADGDELTALKSSIKTYGPITCAEPVLRDDRDFFYDGYSKSDLRAHFTSKLTCSKGGRAKAYIGVTKENGRWMISEFAVADPETFDEFPRTH